MNTLYLPRTHKHRKVVALFLIFCVVAVTFVFMRTAIASSSAHNNPSDGVVQLAQQKGLKLQSEVISKRTTHSRTFNTSVSGTYISEFFPCPDPEDDCTDVNDTVDGYIANRTTTSWDATRNGVATHYVNDNISNSNIGVSGGSSRAKYVTRAILGFDTSSIGSDTINSANLTVNVVKVEDRYGEAQGYINVVQPSPASATALSFGDFESFSGLNGTGSIMDTGSDDKKDLTHLGTGEKTWTLNATGISWIVANGITWLGLAEGHDIEDVEPAGGLRDGPGNRINFYFSESGIATAPRLVVIHSTLKITPSGTTPAIPAAPAIPPMPREQGATSSNRNNSGVIPATPAVPAIPTASSPKQ